jgi:Spy/CpxP family protein refolding chaperone
VAVNFKPLILTIAALACACSTSVALAAAPQTPAADSKERARLEELFIWKTSEELKLGPAEEQKFTDVVHDLNKRRREANARMDDALAALASAKTKAESEKALSAHRAALRETQNVQNAELDRLRPLLGSEKLARYIVTKSSILEKLKTMLAAPSAMPAATGTTSSMTLPPATSGAPSTPASKTK